MKPPAESNTPCHVHQGRPARPLPVWIDVKDVKEKTGLTEERLRQLVRAGYVRRAKLGESRQAASLYRTENILDALGRISRGLEPRKKR